MSLPKKDAITARCSLARSPELSLVTYLYCESITVHNDTETETTFVESSATRGANSLIAAAFHFLLRILDALREERRSALAIFG